MFIGVSRFVRAGAASHLHTLGKSGIAYRLLLFCRLALCCGETHFPHPSLLLRGVGSRCRDIESSWGFCLSCAAARYICLRAALFVPYGAVPQFAASLWGPRPNAPSSGGPRPFSSSPLPTVAPPPRWSGARDIGIWGTSPQAFLSADALGVKCGLGAMHPRLLWPLSGFGRVPRSIVARHTPDASQKSTAPVASSSYLLSRARILPPRLPRCSLDVVGSLSN